MGHNALSPYKGGAEGPLTLSDITASHLERIIQGECRGRSPLTGRGVSPLNTLLSPPQAARETKQIEEGY